MHGPVQAAVDMVKLIPVSARQAVAGVFGVGVAADGQHIIACCGSAGRVQHKARVGPSVLAQRDAVEPDIGESGRAVKAYKEGFSLLRRRPREVDAVPGGFVPVHVVGGVPGVRHSDSRPGGVVKCGFFSAGHEGKTVKVPGAIQRHGFASCVSACGGGRRGVGRDSVAERDWEQNEQKQSPEQTAEAQGVRA